MEQRTELKKTLKPHWVWAIALGSSIGWGAFVQPTNWIAQSGPLGVMIGFIIGALLMMLIAVSYGFLIREYPVSGGEFAYAYISLGRTHAFISGWFLTLGYICIVALNASALALMFKFVFPTVIENFMLYTVAGWDVYMTEILVATIGLLIFAYLNIKGSGLTGSMQFVFCVVMLLSVFLLTGMVGAAPGTGLANVQPFFNPEMTTFASIISIVAIAPWAYVGFDNVPQAAEEFNFSSQKAFGLIIFALMAAALLYCFMILATAMTAPWQDLIGQNGVWGTGDAIQRVLGNGGLAILVTALSMGIFTGLNGFIISSSRLLFAMSRAKMLPRAFSRLHPRTQTPYVGIAFTVGLSMVAPWFGREVLMWVVDMSSIGVSIAYFYTCFTAYKLYGWSADSERTSSVFVVSPIKKSMALLGAIASAIFVALLLVPGSPAVLGKESLIALLIWTALGGIFYLVKRQEYLLIPERELNYLILGKEAGKVMRQNCSEVNTEEFMG
ncbi:APC family permease [Edaphobacillus lindanitolerans]|uniref:Amino acid/polyamine/organocation transporter, APC superfamily n=1 Tax=Edaphobacillus lindanitolerans TaxID=550447 RepID=A0A1U7PN79_9BACI|nr:APC family permease [Edaphobacillus lindanitolerans]SIT73539.1 amino acid/polyamine/organocation transporter, APC superfamily [Edaphobacillus lindanitolerans]